MEDKKFDDLLRFFSTTYKRNTGWNDKIVAIEKTTWIHFRLMKTGFPFFSTDHLLVGQLCTNPKSDRSLLSCLKVTQCSTSEIGDAPLYNSCSLPIQVMTTGPLPAPSKCKSGLPRITGTCPGWWKQSFRRTVMVFGVVSSEGHIMPPHIFEVGLKFNTKVYLDVPKSVVIPWCNQVAGSRLGAGPQVQRDPGLASEGVLRLCTLLSLDPLLPRTEPAGLLRLVIRQEHHQHNLPQHQNQPDRCHPPSICRAPAGARGKGILPVLDPYRGGDWGWRRLHWIDISSTT